MVDGGRGFAGGHTGMCVFARACVLAARRFRGVARPAGCPACGDRARHCGGQAQPRAMNAALAVLGLVAVAAVGLLHAVRSAPAAAVLLGEPAAGAGSLGKELARDAALLAALDGSGAPAAHAAPRESPQQRKQHRMMMSKFGAVPASW